MPITDSTQFLARFPEFSGVPVAKIDLELTDAEADTSATYFGTQHVRAVHLLTAHRIAMLMDDAGNAIPGQAGGLQMATADGVSSTYIVPDGLSREDVAFWGTVYGQRFIELRDRIDVGVLVAAG